MLSRKQIIGINDETRLNCYSKNKNFRTNNTFLLLPLKSNRAPGEIHQTFTVGLETNEF